MAVKSKDKTITAIYHGGVEIVKAYKGNNVVFQKAGGRTITIQPDSVNVTTEDDAENNRLKIMF